METILVVEDNTDVNHLLAETLQTEGYQVTSAYDGIVAKREALSGKYDLIILDIMLPYVSGDEILRELRKVSDIPVLILSAKDMITTKIDLLKLGADDYVTKPFDIGEVCARIEALIRRKRSSLGNSQAIKFRDIVLDTGLKTVEVHGQMLTLTAKEYLILELFLTHPEKVFSKANLYEALWNESYYGDDNTIKTHISNLRNKLKAANESAEYIETVWGLGYRLYQK
jgi:DNA-binding response OmpR family regulator